MGRVSRMSGFPPAHSDRILFQSDLVRLEEFRCAGGPAPRGEEEAAERHELVWVRAGVFVRHDQAGDLTADPNHVLFFTRGQPYQVSHPLEGGDRNLILAIGEEALLALLAEAAPAPADPSTDPFPARRTLVTPAQIVRLHHLLQALDLSDPLAVEEQALGLVANLVAGPRPPASRPIRPAEAELADAARLALNTCFREKLSLGALAALIHVSPYHLCRVFRRQTGLSLHQYRLRLRLLGLLEHLADHPAAEIAPLAMDFGFASHSHCATAFRRAFGLSPSALFGDRPTRRRRDLSRILKAPPPRHR